MRQLLALFNSCYCSTRASRKAGNHRLFCVLAALHWTAIAPSAIAQSDRKAELVVSVANGKGEPVEDAIVSIAALGLTARTNWIGESHLRQVPSGSHRLDIRRVGYSPLVTDVNVVADTVGVFVVLTPLSIQLDTLRVVASQQFTELL